MEIPKEEFLRGKGLTVWDVGGMRYRGENGEDGIYFSGNAESSLKVRVLSFLSTGRG